MEQDLTYCLLKDRHFILQSIKKYKKNKNPKLLRKIEETIENSKKNAELRKKNIPTVPYEQNLPILEKKEEISELIKNNQVVVIAGETGSGKTTQLPKICLELGLGVLGMIGHTQPRRIAAKSVAERVSEELKVPLGKGVGYKIRFNDKTDKNTYVKVMTDGILLTEAHHDKYLSSYDTIIIDEAHERSLNIDFLLGILKVILKKRKDLKLIVTSATIDVQKFSKYFNNAPVIEVSGRTYPVEVRYKEDYEVKHAVEELIKEGPGDILVFLPGEKQIRETQRVLQGSGIPNLEVITLFARLSSKEQHKIFERHSNRRVILSTNIAETSLTVPGIRYVIDTGDARISRYNYKNQVQRLPIEAISQASANQRKGRCGRVESGICIRLYSKEDFSQRALYTEPEIKRTGLAMVVLQMLYLGLGKIEEFPFLEKPDNKYIREAFRILLQIQAVDDFYRLTEIGKKLVKFPIEPRLGAMLLEGSQLGCLHEALIIVSFLSIQDPRERPLEKQQQSDECHNRFKDKKSDFCGILNLWKYLQEQKELHSKTQFKKKCTKEFLSAKRVEDWFDIYNQTKEITGEMKLSFSSNSSYELIHKAIMKGVLNNISELTEDGYYKGANDKKSLIFPGSYLKKRQPKWIMSFSLIETVKVYSNIVADIDISWVESQAEHLLKYKFYDPYWSAKQNQVLIKKQASLFGLVIYSERRVNYYRVNKKDASDIFIREALANNDFRTELKFFKQNQNLIKELTYLEEKSRKRGIVAGEEELFHFYREILPIDVYNEKTLKKWIKENSDNALLLNKEILLNEMHHGVSFDEFPDKIKINEIELKLEYSYSDVHDGVTVVIPSNLIERLEESFFEWLVPGLYEEKLNFLLKSLPKNIRKNFIPVSSYVSLLMEKLTYGKGNLFHLAAEILFKTRGTLVPKDSWDKMDFPAHLKMTYKVIDSDEKVLKITKKWNEVEELVKEVSSFCEEKERFTTWPNKTFFEKKEIEQSGAIYEGYVVLHDDLNAVTVKTVVLEEEAKTEHIKGVCRLMCFNESKTVKYLNKSFKKSINLTFKNIPMSLDELFDDMIMSVLREIVKDNIPKSSKDFNECLLKKTTITESFNKKLRAVVNIFKFYKLVKDRTSKLTQDIYKETVQDINKQIDSFFQSSFCYNTPEKWFSRIPMYFKAIIFRLDNLKLNKEFENIRQIEVLMNAYEKYLKERSNNHLIEEYRWMVEEFRISCFAQTLKTISPVSLKRLSKMLESAYKI